MKLTPFLGKSILIVDDEPDLLDVLSLMLGDFGCKVIKASSADEALASMESGVKIDFVFSDAIMPQMDGFALLERSKSLRPNLPFCLISGYSDKTASEVAAHGAIGYLSKPFSTEAIKHILLQYLGTDRPNRARESSISALPSQKVPVAVFEESQRDQAFLYKGFDQERDGSPLDLHVFSNKEKFIQFLQSAQKWKGVLVIDIASSGLPGLELLERIRLNSIVDVRTPIIILSEKRDQNIQDRAKQLGVASFYKRPSKQEQWWHVARAIRQSWLGETSQSADHNLAS